MSKIENRNRAIDSFFFVWKLVTFLMPIGLLVANNILGPGLLYGLAGSTTTNGSLSQETLNVINTLVAIGCYILLLVFFKKAMLAVNNSQKAKNVLGVPVVITTVVVFFIVFWPVLT